MITLTACVADKETLPEIDDYSYKSVSELKQEMQDNALAYWNESEKVKTDLLNIDKTHLPCNCYYEVIDIKVIPPPEHPEFEVGLICTEPCFGDPFACNYFNGRYTSEAIQHCVGFPSQCEDVWASLVPSGSFKFNCGVTPNSSFGVRLNSNWAEPNCFEVGCAFSEGTFRIKCFELCEEEDHWRGFWAYSQPFKLIYDPNDPSGTPDNGKEEATISLSGECGCVPKVNTAF